MMTIHTGVYRRGDGLAKLQTQSDRIGRSMTKIFVAKSLAIDKYDKKYEVLKKKKFKIDCRLSDLRHLREKNCHHNKEKYGRKEWPNMRDDASFGTYVACGNCESTLWDECYGPGGGYG